MHVSSSEQKLESQLRFRRCQADRDVQSELAGPEDGQSWCRARLGVLSYAALATILTQPPVDEIKS